MFQVKSDHLKRLIFASKIFPRLQISHKLDWAKIKSTDKTGQFCGGRSKHRDLLTFFGGLAGSSVQSSFIQLPLLRRSLKKLINIVELELEGLGAQEVLLPTFVPEKLWHESNRLERQKDALDTVYRLSDHDGNSLLLGPTFEESITKLLAGYSYIKEDDLPLLLYQTSSKFRLEPNPRFGLLRSNEFLMNDLYSFDANIDRAIETYDKVTQSYKNIFDKLGLQCSKTESVTGDIGGRYSHEYQLEVQSGEDTLCICNSCGSRFNKELFDTNKSIKCLKCDSDNLDRKQVLELGHTFLLSDVYSKPLQAKFTAADNKTRQIFEMGCYGLGLTRILGAGLDLMSIIPESPDEFLQMRWPRGTEPFEIGIVAPARRSKQFNAGSSQFIESLSGKILDWNPRVDMIIEDRDNESLVKRLMELQSLGVPKIVVVGSRFLQDEPQVEYLTLNFETRKYEQQWFSEDQVLDHLKQIK